MSQAAMNTYVTELEAENERLREAIAEAEKVIKPLADVMKNPMFVHLTDDSSVMAKIGDLRAARRWMEGRK